MGMGSKKGLIAMPNVREGRGRSDVISIENSFVYGHTSPSQHMPYQVRVNDQQGKCLYPNQKIGQPTDTSGNSS
jgi:hypothetical protein